MVQSNDYDLYGNWLYDVVIEGAKLPAFYTYEERMAYNDIKSATMIIFL